LGHKVFFDVKLWGPEIDKEPGFDASRFQIAKQLGDVLVYDTASGFQLHDELILNEKIREKFAKQRAVLVIDVKRMLLENLQTVFAEAVCETILVDFLGMALAMVFMQGKASFTDDVAELVYVFEPHAIFVTSRVFRGQTD
jgi:hypothetical protein